MSYTLAYQGAEIDDILARAVPGGAIDQALATKQDALTFDAVPTEGSTNPAESGGIYDAIQAGGAAALAAFATDSVSGDVVSFPDGASNIPVKAFTGSIIPAQSGSGDPAPDNVRPISGWTGAEIYRRGINLWDEQWEVGGYNISNGEKTVDSTRIRCANPIPVVDGESYYALFPSGASAYRLYYDATGAYVGNSGSSIGSGVFTVPSGVRYITFYMNAGYGTTYGDNISINYPSTVTTYQPYNGQTITLPFGANIWNEQWELGSIDNSGNFTGGSSTFRVKSKIPVTGGKEYVLVYGSISAPTRTLWGFWYDNSETLIGTRFEITNSPTTLKAPANAKYFAFRTGGNAPATSYLGDIAIRDVIVYAGTLTALGGGLWKIQPTHAALTLNGSESWAAYASGNGYRMTVSGMSSGEAQIGWTDWLATVTNLNSLGVEFGRNDARIYAAQANTIPSVTDLASWQAYLGTHPLTILYPLATLPDPITITGEDLQTLLGANTVWTDCGGVTELTYRADTALYIQKLISGGGTLSTLSMASPSPSLSLGRVGVLAEPEVSEQEQTDEEAEQLEQTEEPEQTEEE